MKSIEDYIDDYLDKYNKLSKEEGIRVLKFTPEEFIRRAEEIQAFQMEFNQKGYFNERKIAREVDSMFRLLLQDEVIENGSNEQFEERKKARAEHYARDAPKIQAYIKGIQAPVEFGDVVILYNALSRNQITLEMIPSDVLEEFKQTRQFLKVFRVKVTK